MLEAEKEESPEKEAIINLAKLDIVVDMFHKISQTLGNWPQRKLPLISLSQRLGREKVMEISQGVREKD